MNSIQRLPIGYSSNLQLQAVRLLSSLPMSVLKWIIEPWRNLLHRRGSPESVRDKTVRGLPRIEKHVLVASDDYINFKHGFQIRYVVDWTVDETFATCQEPGCCFTITSPDRKTRLSVFSWSLSADLRLAQATSPEKFRADWKQARVEKFEVTRQKSGGNPMRRLEIPSLDGETELLCLEFDVHESDGRPRRLGTLCALHEGSLFRIRYEQVKSSRGDIGLVLGSWRWSQRPGDAELAEKSEL